MAKKSHKANTHDLQASRILKKLAARLGFEDVDVIPSKKSLNAWTICMCKGFHRCKFCDEHINDIDMEKFCSKPSKWQILSWIFSNKKLLLIIDERHKARGGYGIYCELFKDDSLESLLIEDELENGRYGSNEVEIEPR